MPAWLACQASSEPLQSDDSRGQQVTHPLNHGLIASRADVATRRDEVFLPAGNTELPPTRSLADWAADSLLVAILAPFLALSSSWMPRLLLAIVILDIPLQV